jgi:hypothetical protein
MARLSASAMAGLPELALGAPVIGATAPGGRAAHTNDDDDGDDDDASSAHFHELSLASLLGVACLSPFTLFAAAARALLPVVSCGCPSSRSAGGCAPARGDASSVPAEGTVHGDAADADPAAAAYDAEAAADDFHESRFLRPEYQLLHPAAASQDGSGFLCPPPVALGAGGGAVIRRERYTFSLPTSADLFDFMFQLFSCASLTPETTIVSLIFVERLLEQGRVALRAHNWRPIVLSAVLLASKVMDDLGSWSVEFAAVYPQFSVAAINAMERVFCAKIGYSLYVPASTFTRYYFALRSLGEQRSFRQRYMNMLSVSQGGGVGATGGVPPGPAAAIPVGAPSGAGGGAGGAMAKRIEEASKGLRSQLYSRSL